MVLCDRLASMRLSIPILVVKIISAFLKLRSGNMSGLFINIYKITLTNYT